MADFIRVLPNGWTLEAFPLTFGRGRLGVTFQARDVGQCYDDLW